MNRHADNIIRWLGRGIWGSLRWWWRHGLKLILFAVLFIALFPSSTVLRGDLTIQIGFRVSAYQFDYIGWTLGAIGAKAEQTLLGQHPFLDEAARSQFVRDYFADLSTAQQLERDIAAVYADPDAVDPAQQTASLQLERDALRADLQHRQSTAEAILEGQVAAILVEQGFGVGGQLLPPLAMRFTQVPNLLVVSPRDTIRFETSINIVPLPIDETVALEAEIDATYDVSSLIVPLGGIALYPAMIYETTSLSFAIETFAHEWLHHYLYFFPLGLSYFTGDAFAGDARRINETTADLFGKEMAQLVSARYYPELLPPDLPEQPRQSTPPAAPPDPDAFDFGAEMHETRVRIDALLATGDVEAAEMYMAERQRFFHENGFRLRKLNQAFFAFYGGYQAGGGIAGAGGADPIGPAVQAVRQQSPSLQAFILHMRPITDLEGLLALEARLLDQPSELNPNLE